jgi:peptidoglycan-N-acetylglucosamine deacetylase
MANPRFLIPVLAALALLAGAPHHAATTRAQADPPPAAETTLAPSSGCVAAGAQVRRSAKTTREVVALTFDDGPSDFTPAILRILGSSGVPATFFEIGRNMAGREALMRQVIAAGDEIGDHTFDHIDLPPLSTTKVRDELSRTQAEIKRVTGYNTCLYRPPHGRYDARTNAIARKLGLLTILWSIDTKDFTMPGTDAIYRSAVNGAKPGAIILMHEGGGNRSETVAALPRIIATLKARGYQFATVSQLLGLQSVTR